MLGFVDRCGEHGGVGRELAGNAFMGAVLAQVGCGELAREAMHARAWLADRAATDQVARVQRVVDQSIGTLIERCPRIARRACLRDMTCGGVTVTVASLVAAFVIAFPSRGHADQTWQVCTPTCQPDAGVGYDIGSITGTCTQVNAPCATNSVRVSSFRQGSAVRVPDDNSNVWHSRCGPPLSVPGDQRSDRGAVHPEPALSDRNMQLCQHAIRVRRRRRHA